MTVISHENSLFMNFLYREFENIAKMFPDKIAVRYFDQELSYALLNACAEELAQSLSENNIQGKIIGVIIPSSLEMVCAMLGVFKSGNVYFPIEKNLPENRILHMLQDVNCDIIIAGTGNNVDALEGVLTSVKNVIKIDNHLQLTKDISKASESCKKSIQQLDASYIYYTSGTTGMGKPILGTYAGPLHFIHWQRNKFKLSENEIVSQLVQSTFDGSMRDFWIALSSGSTLAIPRESIRYNNIMLLEWMSRQKVTITHCVPSLFKLWTKDLESIDLNLSSLRYIFMSGEQLYGRDIFNWRKVAGESTKLINLYGTSEGTMAQSFHIIEEIKGPDTRVPAGMPIDDSFLILVNRNNQLCRIGEKGEIYIKTPNLTKGYLNNIQKTNEFFVQNPLNTDREDLVFKTGDLGIYLEDRSVEILGRFDHQIKFNGVRINLKDIERSVLLVPGIDQAVVTVDKDNVHEKLICFHTNSSLSGSFIRSHLKESLSASVIPSVCVYTEKFPLTTNGKVDVKALIKLQSQPEKPSIQKPTDDIELKIHDIWCEVLGFKAFDKTTSFFEAGGTSLKAMRLIANIYKKFKKLPGIAELYDNDTIQKMSVWVKGGENTSDIHPVKSIEEQDHYGLSHGQRRLWFLCQFQNSGTVYNMNSAYSIKGVIDEQVLREAVKFISNRHEVLRSNFVRINNEVRQITTEQLNIEKVVKFYYENTLFENIAYQTTRKEINLEQDPLWNVVVVRHEKDQFKVLVVMHHIISDGWSMIKFFDELLSVYTNLANQREIDAGIEPLKLQYRDYSYWQHKGIEENYFNRQKSYWNDLFKSLPSKLNINGKKREEFKSYNGNRLNIMLSEQTAEKIHRLGQKGECTVFTVLLALVHILLYKYSNQTRQVIGSSFASRTKEEFRSQIGFFVNNLPFLIDLAPDSTFESFLNNLKKHTTEVLDHQEYPFDLLIDDLKLYRDTSRSPLFDVFVVLQDFDESTKHTVFDGFQIDQLPIEDQTSKFDLQFNFLTLKNGMGFQLEYNSDIYDESFIKRLMQNFDFVVNHCTNETKQMRDFDIINDKERVKIVEEFNLPQKKVEKPADSILDLFIENLYNHPNKVLAEFEDAQFTYKHIDDLSDKLCYYIQSNYSPTENSIIGILMQKSEWMVVSILAVLKLGCTFMPINPSDQKNRKSYVLMDSGCSLLIVDKISFYEEYNTTTPTLSIERLKNEIIHSPTIKPKYTTAKNAYVIYTSGTTGNPKGVLIDQAGVINRVKWMVENYGINQSDILIQKTPFFFDVSVWEFLIPICFGSKLLICQEKDVVDYNRLYAKLINHCVSFIHFVPSVYNQFLKLLVDRKNPKTYIRQVICSGEALKSYTVRKHYQFFPNTPLDNLYGPTEASIDVSYYRTSKDERIIPIGRPIDNIRIFILNSDKQLSPIGTVGEIAIAGIGLAQGYINKSALTAQKFVNIKTKGDRTERVYLTGDLGYFTEEGNVIFRGRNDDQVKILGNRIELGEIESVISSIEGVYNVAVIKVGTYENVNLYCYYTGWCSEEEVVQLTRSKLPKFMQPAGFRKIENMPITVNGKIDKKSLLDQHRSNVKAGNKKAKNQIEQDLLDIYNDILSYKPVSVNDNFFEIGGNSLQAIVVVSLIKSKMKREILLEDFFKYPTIEELALYIEELPIKLHTSMNQLEEQCHYPLSPMQLRVYTDHNMDENNSAYNMQFAYRLKGNIDVDILEDSFSIIVKKWEVLRSKFIFVNDEPRVVFKEAIDIQVEVVDCCRFENNYAEVRNLANRVFREPFQLDKDLLIKIVLLKLSHAHHVMLLKIHHIIFDAHSKKILLNDLISTYNKAFSNESELVEKKPMQYKDFLSEYYNNLQIDSTLPTTSNQKEDFSVKTDFSRTGNKSFTGAICNCKLRPDQASGLDKLSKKHNLTVFNFLLASVKVLLLKHNHQEKIIVNVPLLGRSSQHSLDQIGLFINNIQLITKVSGSLSFLELVKSLHITLIKSEQKPTFKSDLNQTGVIVNMTEENSVEQIDAIPGITISPFDLDHFSSKAEISFDFNKISDEIFLKLIYNSDLFEEETIKLMIERFKILLDKQIEDPDRLIEDLDLITEYDEEIISKEEVNIDFDFYQNLNKN